MEPAVGSPWIESAIITDRARNPALLTPQGSQNFWQPAGVGRQNPCRGERNFWMQRREAKNRPERPRTSPETERVERYQRKSQQKRPNESRRRHLRFRRTGWWGWYGPNCQLPTQSSNRSPTPTQERNFLLQRPGAEMGSFASNI